MNSFLAVLRALTVAAIVSPGLLAHAEPMNARTGTWETTSTVTLSGNLVPPEALASLPPERRAAVEKMMAEHLGKEQTSTHKGCLNKEDLDQGGFLDFGASCKVEVISRSATHMALKNTCTGNQPSGTIDVTLEDQEHAVGTIEQMTPAGGKIHGKFTSKWLSADCAGGR